MINLRSDRPSRRLVLISLAVIVAACVLLSLLGGYILHERATEKDDQPPPNASQLAILSNGSVVFAPDGSIDAQLVDWFDGGEPKTRRFDAGGNQFAAASATPKAKDLAKLSNFVRILNAYPKTEVEIVGYAEQSVPENLVNQVKVARAKWLYDRLKEAGIEERRLSFRPATPSESAASQRVHSGQFDARIEVVLTKH